MLIYPAIDLQDGVCVRLVQGRFDDSTRYGHPRAQLAAFAQAGAQWVHIVDLDGAKQGAPAQYELIGELARSTDVASKAAAACANASTWKLCSVQALRASSSAPPL